MVGTEFTSWFTFLARLTGFGVNQVENSITSRKILSSIMLSIYYCS